MPTDFRNPTSLAVAEHALGLAYLVGEPDGLQAALDTYWRVHNASSPQAQAASDKRVDAMREPTETSQ
jgi:hypothetical protein